MRQLFNKVRQRFELLDVEIIHESRYNNILKTKHIYIIGKKNTVLYRF